MCIPACTELGFLYFLQAICLVLGIASQVVYGASTNRNFCWFIKKKLKGLHIKIMKIFYTSRNFRIDNVESSSGIFRWLNKAKRMLLVMLVLNDKVFYDFHKVNWDFSNWYLHINRCLFILRKFVQMKQRK